MANTFVSIRRLQRFYNGLKNKFALKSEVPSKTSDLTNDSDFVQGTYFVNLSSPSTAVFNNAVQAYESGRNIIGLTDEDGVKTLFTFLGTISLSGNITRLLFGFSYNGNFISITLYSNGTTQIDTKIYDTDVDGIIDKANADSDGNVFQTTYALKSSVPTKTSDLTNDSGFLTSHQDISGKVNVYQGTTNQNKYLGINESGNVEPRSGLTVTDSNGTVTFVSSVGISGSGGGSGSGLPDTTNATPGDFLVLDNNKEPIWKTIQSVMGESIPLGN